MKAGKQLAKLTALVTGGSRGVGRGIAIGGYYQPKSSA